MRFSLGHKASVLATRTKRLPTLTAGGIEGLEERVLRDQAHLRRASPLQDGAVGHL